VVCYFPQEHWKHLRTSNPVEAPFAAVPLRTTAVKHSEKGGNASALLWKLPMLAERTFRKLNGYHLLGHVIAGRTFENGKPAP
jgi:putative transposase